MNPKQNMAVYEKELLPSIETVSTKSSATGSIHFICTLILDPDVVLLSFLFTKLMELGKFTKEILASQVQSDESFIVTAEGAL